ncbi:MAG: DmsE family decaheme c-type cytochrome [Acidobacteriota bacterium]
MAWLLPATVVIVLWAASVGAAQQPAAGAKPAPAPEYAGSEACQACHEDIYRAFQRNPHQRVETDKRRGWAGRACESCHGPGAKHAESVAAADILHPPKLEPGRADQNCLKCHLREPPLAARIQGGHGRGQVACGNCHSMHKEPERLRPRQPARINQQCAGCHAAEWAQFQRPHRHRLPEGAMSCTDCHNPHGSPPPQFRRVVSANEPGCFRCHGDKRGPFVFEHAPVRLEGCRACHEPHGSANPRLLNRAEVRFQCLECHSNIGAGGALGGIPPGLHDLRSPRFRNCTICHSKIHGSQVDRGLRR